MFEYFCLPPQRCALKSVSMAGVFHLIPASVSQAGEHLIAPVVSINLPSSSERDDKELTSIPSLGGGCSLLAVVKEHFCSSLRWFNSV